MIDTLEPWDVVVATSFRVPVSSVLNVIKKCQRKFLMGVRSSQEQNLEMCIPVQPTQMWPSGPLMYPHHKVQHQKGVSWVATCEWPLLLHHLSSVYKTVVKMLLSPGKRQSSAGTRALAQWWEGCAQWSWVPWGNMPLEVRAILQEPVLVGTYWPWHHHK